MQPIKINNSEEFRKELEKLDFIEIQNINGKYNIKCVCDDWFAKWMNSNLIGGYDSEESELILMEKLDLHYLTFDQLSKFVEVVKKYG